MTTRRQMIRTMGAVVMAAAARSAIAQRPDRAPRIGVLLATAAADWRPPLDSFRGALRELGWTEGQNVHIEYRFAEGKTERYAELAAELVRLNVNVILTSGDQLTLVLKRATATIPIVMAGVGNPVASGLVSSLARPGGNVTGVSNLAVGMPVKWLELIKECLPATKRIAALRNLGNPTHDLFWNDSQEGAVKLGFNLIPAEYRNLTELTGAFAAAAPHAPNALLVFPDPIVVGAGAHIAKLAEQYRWPSVALLREYPAAGGLMSYGPSRLDNYRRAAHFVDKILRGAKPAEMPVEQARQFELVVNERTAKALGIKVPQAILLRADDVIR